MLVKDFPFPIDKIGRPSYIPTVVIYDGRNMKLTQKLNFLLLAVIGSLCAVSGAACAPPPGFVDVPHPTLVAPKLLVSHTEEITVDQPLAVVLDAASRTDLKDAIHKSSSLPGVSGEYPLNDVPFGKPGARRLVCLSDGSTLEEQVLEQERNQTSSRFRYIVWNYTTKQARPIEYGIGEFRHTEMPGGRTHIVWTYSFKLQDHEFPGYLGALGRYLFRIGFLDRQYAAMMRGTLRAGKQNAEQQPSGATK
jgi:hypothetical protein